MDKVAINMLKGKNAVVTGSTSGISHNHVVKVAHRLAQLSYETSSKGKRRRSKTGLQTGEIAIGRSGTIAGTYVSGGMLQSTH
jgi:NAD(P)-dependent dehydrogenase (short-subunit alcohol dehydrogenase family)